MSALSRGFFPQRRYDSDCQRFRSKSVEKQCQHHGGGGAMEKKEPHRGFNRRDYKPAKMTEQLWNMLNAPSWWRAVMKGAATKRRKEENKNQTGEESSRARSCDFLSFCAMEIMSRIYLSLPLLTAPPWHFDLRGCEQFIKNGSRSKWACNAQPFSGNLNGSQPISDKVKCWRRRPGDVNRPDYWERWMLTGAGCRFSWSIREHSFTECVYTQQARSVGCRLPPAMFYLLL